MNLKELVSVLMLFFFPEKMGNKGQIGGTGGGSIIVVVLNGLIAYLVTVQLISGTALATNAFVSLIVTLLIPLGIMVGTSKVLGLI